MLPFSPAPDAAEPIAAEATQDVPAAAADVVSASEGEASSESTAVEATVVPPEPVVAAEAAAPEMVEVWRPGGRSEERRPRHDRNRHRRPEPRQDGAQPAAAEGVAVVAEGGEKRERHGHGRRGRRDRHKEFRKPDAPAEGAPARSENSPGREPREGKGRPPRERFQGKGRDRDHDKGKFQGARKGGREGRDGRADGGASLRPYASSAPRERERPMDPNSPFAKLAALKEQLANRKD